VYALAVYISLAAKTQNTSNCIDTSKLAPIRGCVLELCAGIVDKDVSLCEIARQELLEEVGYDVPVDALEWIVTSRYALFSGEYSFSPQCWKPCSRYRLQTYICGAIHARWSHVQYDIVRIRYDQRGHRNVTVFISVIGFIQCSCL